MSTQSAAHISPTDAGFALRGVVVYDTVNALAAQAESHWQAAATNGLTIDCTALERIDSAGIALLLKWHRHALKQNIPCHFRDLPPQAQALIDTYRLTDLLSA